MECEQAIAILIDSGCAVEHNGYHIYKSKTSEYTLLSFDGKGNIREDQEENFPDINDAVKKFVMRTKL